MKLFIRLYVSQLKQYIKSLPLAILGSCIFILLTAVASFGIFKYYETPEDDGIIKATVGVVTNGMDSQYVSLGLGMLGSMASTSDYFSFKVMESDEANKALDKGKIIAIVNFPEGAVEGILNGTNDPVDIRFNQSNPLSSVLLTELTKSGATLLSGAQAGTYTTAELFYKYDKGSELYNAFNDVDELGFKLVLKRGSLFDSYEDDTTNTTIAYYMGTAIILVLIFLGLTMAKNVYFDNDAFLSFGRSQKGFELSYFIAKIASLTTVLYVATIILLSIIFRIQALKHYIPHPSMPRLYLVSLLIALFLASYLSMLMFTMPRSMDGILLVFITSIVLIIVSGLLIPLSFLPDALVKLHNQLPLTGLHNYITSIMKLNANYSTGLIYTFLFMVAGFVLLKLRAKRL